jgi:hypothetical protein
MKTIHNPLLFGEVSVPLLREASDGGATALRVVLRAQGQGRDIELEVRLVRVGNTKIRQRRAQ